MIGADVTRYCGLRGMERLRDIEGLGDQAQAFANAADELGHAIRASVDAILVPYGVTLAQLEKAELP